ncbi:hypothetical protein EAF00_003690 [Botryotinia globosa]|nr:hypothetical protein EAF00_003690 [Botryotinia globosa]
MTNSNNISPNNQSMNQRREMPLEIIINNAWKHYKIKTGFLFNRSNINTNDLYKASSSQSADAPGTSLEPPCACSMSHFRAHTNTSQGGHQLRGDAPSFHARKLLADSHLLHNRRATSRTPIRGFSSYRSSIKDVWDRVKAASENSGAHTSTTIFNPTIQAFIPSQGFLPRRSQVVSENSSAYTSTTIFNPTIQAFIPSQGFLLRRSQAASENSGAYTSTTIFNPTIQAFIPSQGFLPRRSQVVSENSSAYTSTTIFNPTIQAFIPSQGFLPRRSQAASENSGAHTSTTIFNPTIQAFIPFQGLFSKKSQAANKNSDAYTSTTILNPTIQAFIPSPEFLPRGSQTEVDSEYDCGFSHCGGFCANYPALAVNGDNNGARQQASSSPVRDESQANIIPSQAGIERTLEEEIDYDGDHTKEDDCLNHDSIESACSS